jgi:RND superfamily putative drug exporter
MRRIAHTVVNHPWLVVLAWLVAIVAISAFGPSYGSVKQAGINLPATSESVRAGNLEAAKFGRGDTRPTATVVTGRPSDAPELRRWLSGVTDVAQVAQAQPSGDGRAALIPIVFDHRGSDLDQAVAAIEGHLKGTPAAVTGEAPINHDFNTNLLSGSSNTAVLSPTRIVTLLIVLVILALVYRAPLAVITPLICIGVVIALSPHVVAAAALWLGLPVGNFSLPFMFTVTLGAGTNYGLFLISRYREMLGRGLASRPALEEALVQVGAAITSSAATVIAATGVMIFATFDLFRTLGPAVAISIAVMLLAGLTLLPALMSIFGRAFLWPRRPVAGRPQAVDRGVWRRVGDLVAAKPLLAAVVPLVLLLPAAGYAATVQPSFSFLDALPGNLPSTHGYRLLASHFPASLGTLTLLVEPASDASQVRRAVGNTPDVASVSQPQVSSDGSVARLSVAVTQDPNGTAAAATVDAAERAARQAAPTATVLAAGSPSGTRDFRDLLYHDFLLIAALVGIAICAVLAVLLRSLVAPIYLLFTVALSTAVAVGLVAFIYQRAVGVSLYWTAPVFAFVFLVALGEDFNILLVSRLRQEVAAHGAVEGVARAVGGTGGVITSCGLVMACVFFVGLVRNPIYLLQEIGVAVVIGVLLDTFLIRPVLVPALALLFRSTRRWAAVGAGAAEPTYDPAR